MVMLVRMYPMFQSSPTPKGGRYRTDQMQPVMATPYRTRRLLRRMLVSILAHPERWALRLHELSRGISAEFQSCGRYVRWPSQVNRWFQSSPTPKGGRYYISNHCSNRVSILAHPERWALRSNDYNYTVT